MRTCLSPSPSRFQLNFTSSSPLDLSLSSPLLPYTPALHAVSLPPLFFCSSSLSWFLSPPQMGNNPSKSPADASSASGQPAINTSVNDKKLNRRPSINALSGAKATAADPSASKETATGYSAAQAASAQRLQPQNIPDSPTRGVDRSDRRDARKSDSRPSDIPFSPDPSNPVQVPASRSAARHDPFPPVTPSALPHNTYYNASTHLQRPPRMPLPIGDATATPGSPVTGPPDSHIGTLPHDRLLDEHGDPDHSNVGNTTIDEDEIVDELQPYTVSGVGKAIPTIIQWAGPGKKVYVTGTFVNWEKKFRLHGKYVVSRLVSCPLVFCPVFQRETCSYPA